MSVHAKASVDGAEKREEASEQTSPYGSPDSQEWRLAERKLVRKLDMTLMPMVWVLYMFNYLDRNNIA